jgi:hypothetical protein
MIANNKTPPPDPRLAWAAERLDTAPAGRSGDFTVGLLRRVEEEDFVPPPIVRQAWEVAMGKAAADPAPLDELLEENQRAEIEAFASRFFEIAPADRNRTWRRLANEAARWPRLKVRLESLHPGLNVEFPEISARKPEVRDLLNAAKELFVLQPDRRALRRREILRGPLRMAPSKWQSAARRVRWRYRSIAALSGDLVVPLCRLRSTAQAATRELKGRDLQRDQWRAKRRESALAWLFFIIVVVVIAWNATLSKKENPPDSSPPNYTMPPNWPQPRTERDVIEEALKRRIMDGESGPPTQAPVKPRPTSVSDLPQTSGNLTDQGAKAAIELLIKRGLLRPKQAPVDPADPAQNSDASAKSSATPDKSSSTPDKPSTIPAEAVPPPVSSGPRP